MASISEAKTLGGVGSILLLLTIIPNFGFILGIIGFILILVAMSSISHIVNDHKIFSDMIISVVLSIVAIIIAGVMVIMALYEVLGLGNFSGGAFNLTQNVQPGDIASLLAKIIPFLGAVWVLMILAAVFFRRSLYSTGERTGVSLFGTTGLLYLIGAILIIIGIGLILIFVAEILLIVSFFSINENAIMPLKREGVGGNSIGN